MTWKQKSSRSKFRFSSSIRVLSTKRYFNDPWNVTSRSWICYAFPWRWVWETLRLLKSSSSMTVLMKIMIDNIDSSKFWIFRHEVTTRASCKSLTYVTLTRFASKVDASVALQHFPTSQLIYTFRIRRERFTLTCSWPFPTSALHNGTSSTFNDVVVNIDVTHPETLSNYFEDLVKFQNRIWKIYSDVEIATLLQLSWVWLSLTYVRSRSSWPSRAQE